MTKIQQLQEMLAYIAWRVAIIHKHALEIPDEDRDIIDAKLGDMLKVIAEQEQYVMDLETLTLKTRIQLLTGHEIHDDN